MVAGFKFNQKGWDQLISGILATEGVDRMMRVADSANYHGDTTEYMVSTEGTKPLRKRDYRVTVITAGAEAIRDNNNYNTLLRCFHLASGG